MDFAVIPNVKQEIPNLVKNDKAIETAINTVTNYMKPLRVTVDQLHYGTTGELHRVITCRISEHEYMKLLLLPIIVVEITNAFLNWIIGTGMVFLI